MTHFLNEGKVIQARHISGAASAPHSDPQRWRGIGRAAEAAPDWQILQPHSQPTNREREHAMSQIVSLRQMHVGQQGKIATVEALGEMNRRIRDMGLIPGTTVSVVGRAPLKDPVALRLSGVTISLRNSEADYIKVDLSGAVG